MLVLYGIVLSAWPSIKQDFLGWMFRRSVLDTVDSLIFFGIEVRTSDVRGV